MLYQNISLLKFCRTSSFVTDEIQFEIQKNLKYKKVHENNLSSFKLKLYDPFLLIGFNVSRLQSLFEETIYFLPLSLKEFLVLIWLTSEWWKTELTLAPPCGIEPGTTELRIQHSNHQAIHCSIKGRKRKHYCPGNYKVIN